MERVFGFANSGAANYNALLVSAEKRMGHGLQFKGAYTWSKNLTKNGARTTGNVGQVQDPFNLRNENSFSSDHLPHRFTGNFIYELPFGKGKQLGGNLTGVADKIISGWSLSGHRDDASGFNVYGPTIAGGQLQFVADESLPARPLTRSGVGGQWTHYAQI